MESGRFWILWQNFSFEDDDSDRRLDEGNGFSFVLPICKRKHPGFIILKKPKSWAHARQTISILTCSECLKPCKQRQ